MCYSLIVKAKVLLFLEYAKENGYDAVTTTLLYSIYQNHDFIKEYMEKLSEEELNSMLQEAIDNEDYELASVLRDEMDKRFNH